MSLLQDVAVEHVQSCGVQYSTQAAYYYGVGSNTCPRLTKALLKQLA